MTSDWIREQEKVDRWNLHYPVRQICTLYSDENQTKDMGRVATTTVAHLNGDGKAVVRIRLLGPNEREITKPLGQLKPISKGDRNETNSSS